MFDVKILRDLYIYTSYINYEVLKIFLLELIDSKFYTVYPACDVIKTDLIIKQDGGRLVSFVLQYFRNWACFEKVNNWYCSYPKGSYG